LVVLGRQICLNICFLRDGARKGLLRVRETAEECKENIFIRSGWGMYFFLDIGPSIYVC
jgi:hypothetical protein